MKITIKVNIQRLKLNNFLVDICRGAQPKAICFYYDICGHVTVYQYCMIDFIDLVWTILYLLKPGSRAGL